jgi:hypothetical protein
VVLAAVLFGGGGAGFGYWRLTEGDAWAKDLAAAARLLVHDLTR